MRSSVRSFVALLFLLLASSALGVEVAEVALPERSPCLTAEQWAELRSEGIRNLDRLRRDSMLPPARPNERILFEWPLRPVDDLNDSSYYAIVNFVDHAPGADLLLDYECGQRTYDGHNGTDYITWPFWWYKMDHDQVEVVAAAGGTIFDKRDGYHDRSCTQGGTANMVAIRHADGTMAWYLHMKKWSLTSKGVGESVEAGEYLGIVGSSGNSSLPHLHFALRDENWDTFDPYDGPCNETTQNSWWIDQRPYFHSSINAVLTHFPRPVFPACPEQEILNLRDEFGPSDTVYVGVYHRDILAGQVVEYAIRRPDETVAASGSYGIEDPHYPVAFAMISYPLPADAKLGTWRAAVDYLGVRYERDFTVTSPASTSDTVSRQPERIRIAPNPFESTLRIHVEGSNRADGLQLFDAAGRSIRITMPWTDTSSGGCFVWDGRDASGKMLPAGTYFIRIRDGDAFRSKRVLRLR